MDKLDHKRVVGAVIICFFLVLAMTPLGQIAMHFAVPKAQESWLPTAISFVIFELGGQLFAGCVAGYLALSACARIIRIDHPEPVVYSVAAIYATIIIAMFVLHFAMRGFTETAVGSVAQLLGTITGLAIAQQGVREYRRRL